MSTFVPADFSVPVSLEGRGFRLRMLAETDARKDYEAVMESRQRLSATSPNGWPKEDFTLCENVADLRRHEREFHSRLAFAYTVVSPDEQRVLGCVYINPSRNAPGCADVYLWLRDSEHVEGLTLRVYEQVREWLETLWPFRKLNWLRTEYYPDATIGDPTG